MTNFLKFAEAAEENNFEPYHSNEQRSIRILQKMPDIRKNFLIGSLMHLIPIALLYQTKQKVLTQDGLIHAGILGVGLWTFLGYPGWLFCIAYLLLGTLVTKVKMSEKEVRNKLFAFLKKCISSYLILYNRNWVLLKSVVELEDQRIFGEVLQQ